MKSATSKDPSLILIMWPIKCHLHPPPLSRAVSYLSSLNERSLLKVFSQSNSLRFVRLTGLRRHHPNIPQCLDAAVWNYIQHSLILETIGTTKHVHVWPICQKKKLITSPPPSPCKHFNLRFHSALICNCLIVFFLALPVWVTLLQISLHFGLFFFRSYCQYSANQLWEAMRECVRECRLCQYLRIEQVGEGVL